MSNSFNKKIMKFQELPGVQASQYFYNPLVQKDDLEKIRKYKECAGFMLKGYENYSLLDQAIVIFQSMYGDKAKYFGESERFLKRYQIQYSLNIEFTRSSSYDTKFRKKYGLGLILPEIYLLDIKGKDANCFESSVVLGNIFRSIGIECYFKINYITSHVRLIAKIENKYWNFQFQDTGNTFCEESDFFSDGASDERVVLFWNMVSGKILGIQKQIEKAIIVYDLVEYELQSTREITEDIHYLVENRINTLIKNQKYKQAVIELNENKYTKFSSFKRSIFEKLDIDLWQINWTIDETEDLDVSKYVLALNDIVDICSVEEEYFVKGYDIDEDSIRRVVKIKERALKLLETIKND